MKDKYVCNHCGEIFYDNELTPIFSWEGEGCMRGQLFEGYKCPECGSEVNDVCMVNLI